MNERVIIQGKGPSRGAVVSWLQEWQGSADLWTLNNFYAEGFDRDPRVPVRLEGFTVRHYDVHWDQRFWPILRELRAARPGVELVVSPFRAVEGFAEGFQPFPLHAVFQAFGRAYFECSFCFMLADLAMQVRGGRRVRELAIPGCDMSDPTHFSYRFGSHFWLGVLSGLGVKIHVERGAAMLQRVATMPAVETEWEFPHIYGQPEEVSGPWKELYGWWF